MIDTTKIEGYESMSAEEKIKALESYEPDTSGLVKKDLLDKANSEAAKYKNLLKEKMTEEEQNKQKQAEEFESMKSELEALRKEKAIQEHANQFLSLGYDSDLATKTAIALYEGDMQTVFANQKSFQENLVKTERSNILKGTPRPQGGESEKTFTKKDLQGMSLAEVQKFAKENPEVYQSLYKE